MPRSVWCQTCAPLGRRPGPRAGPAPGGSGATRPTCHPRAPSPSFPSLPQPRPRGRYPRNLRRSSPSRALAGARAGCRAVRRKKFSAFGRGKSVSDRPRGTSENAHIGWWRNAAKDEMSTSQTRTESPRGARSAPSSRGYKRSDQRFRGKWQGLEACPESGCALVAYHLGAHITRDAEEFSGRKEEPKLDSLVGVMAGMLFSPGLPAHSVERLNAVDGLFDRLDVRLRAGEEPPSSWRVLGADDNEGRTFVTGRYDVLCEVLRTSGGATECRWALRKARMEWGQLHDAMKEGSAMPEPWWRSTRRL